MLTAAPLDSGRSGTVGNDQRRPIAPGQTISWLLSAPRRCVGIWSGTDRISCPSATVVPESEADSQCRACAAGDRGRAIARDAVTGDDGRTYALYLAWFGPGLVKVGLTAQDRGRDRLLEQGAITHTMLGTGPYTAIRQAERAVAATGLATERVGARAKAEAWWTLPPEAERARLMTSVYDAVRERARWPAAVTPAVCKVVDQAADFGLAQPPADSYAEVIGLADGAVLAGEITAVIGRRVLLDTATGLLLADMRRTAGWQFTLIDSRGHTAVQPLVLDLVMRTRPKDDHENQESLF